MDARYWLYVASTNSSLWNGVRFPDLLLYTLATSASGARMADEFFDHTVLDILVSFPTLLNLRPQQFTEVGCSLSSFRSLS